MAHGGGAAGPPDLALKPQSPFTEAGPRKETCSKWLEHRAAGHLREEAGRKPEPLGRGAAVRKGAGACAVGRCVLGDTIQLIKHQGKPLGFLIQELIF